MNDEPRELSSDARAFLAQASGGDEPSPADRARVRRALMATIAGGAGLAASGAASSAAASSTAAATGAATTATVSIAGSITLKIAAAVVVMGAIGSTVVLAPWENEPAASVETRAARALPRDVPERSTVLVEPALVLPPVLASEAIGAPEPAEDVAHEPAPAGEVPSAPPRGSRAPVRVPMAALEPLEPRDVAPAMPSTPSTLAAEVALLRSAQSALNAGDPDLALSRLADHARRFPDGTMAEEREAARVLALCRAERREDARAAAASFLRDRPASPLAARVRSSCD